MPPVQHVLFQYIRKPQKGHQILGDSHPEFLEWWDFRRVLYKFETQPRLHHSGQVKLLRTGLTSVVEAVDVVGETQGVGMWAMKVGDTVKKPTHDPY